MDHTPSSGPVATAPTGVPERIGAYRLVREIGRGGMATVWLGERCDGQFEHTVAIKIVHTGMDPRLLARFREERRILAQLEHPGIARLLDGGNLADGRPYFVMEHVDGETVTAYAARMRLGIDARLALFRDACAAVAHAHSALVVHRDLTPGNVLVQEDEQGNASIKLIDFGIARVIEAAVAAQATTTAIDIHAMGLLLQALLNGNRHRDLDAIMLKALHDLPDRRYASIAQLSDDIDRYLHGNTVTALRRTWRYRARMFLHRHPWGSVASAAMLAAGVSLAAIHGISVTRERDLARAETAKAEAVSDLLAGMLQAADPEQARGEEVTVREILDLTAAGIARELAGQPALAARMRHIIGGVYARLGAYERADELLRRSLAERERLHGRRSREATDTLHALAVLEWLRGHDDSAESMLRQVLDQRLESMGTGNLQVAEARNDLAAVLRRQGELPECESLYRAALAARRTLLGPAHPDVVSTRHNLAVLLNEQGRYADAEAEYREVLSARRRMHGNVDPGVANTLGNLARMLMQQERHADAEPLLREALDIRRTLYDDNHPRVAAALNSLGGALRGQGRWDEAESSYRAALAIRREAFGEGHQLIAGSYNNLANLYRDKGDPARAAPLYRQAIDIYRKEMGDDHPWTATSIKNLGELLLRMGDYAGAEVQFRETLRIRQLVYGDAHPQVAQARALLASAHPKPSSPGNP